MNANNKVPELVCCFLVWLLFCETRRAGLATPTSKKHREPWKHALKNVDMSVHQG